MFWFFIDIICATAISGAAILLAEWFNASEGYHILFAVTGSISYFFGKYLTGSGAFAHHRYVNAPTPEIVWKASGVICWIIAAISFFYHLP